MKRVATIAGLILVLVVTQSASALWGTTTIDNFGDSSSPVTSLVRSPAGPIYVAWQRRGSDELMWARKTATGWTKKTLTGQNTYTACYSSDTDYIGPSAAFTSTGQARIAHACIAVGGGSPVKYTSQTTAGWKTKRIGETPSQDSVDSSATSLDLVLSPSNRPDIVVTSHTGALVRFRLVAGSWVRHTLLAGGLQYKTPTVSAERNPGTGTLAVALISHAYGGSLLYGEWDGAGTEIELGSVPLGAGLMAFGRPSLAFDDAGEPAIAFQRGEAGVAASLVLARRTSGTWSIVPVDESAQDVGASPGLVIAGGVFHIAYHNETDGDLWYATSSDGTTWETTLAAAGSDVGEFPSLVVTPSGAVRTSHYDRSHTAIKYTKGP